MCPVLCLVLFSGEVLSCSELFPHVMEDSISESDPVHLKIKLFKLTSYFVCPTLRVSQASVENGCECTETEKKTSSAHCRV